MRKRKFQTEEDTKPTIEIVQKGEITMLSAIETILNLVEDSALSSEFIEPLAPFLKYISDLQGITEDQALILAIILETSSFSSVATMPKIAEYLDCKKVKVMQFQSCIDDMVKSKMLKRNTEKFTDNIGYIVSDK